VQGYNVTILAYGQTGSGKSLTMVGHDSGDADTRGIIPRIAEELFEGPAAANGRAKVTLKLMEIYNEQVKDLLADAPSGEKQVPLRVREDPTTGPYVEGLRKHTVATYAEVAKLMEVSSLIARLQLCGESERERERERVPPSYSDAKANRTGRDFGREIAHAAVSRRPPISLYTIVARTEG
jgi:hypothetical protein